MVNKLRARALTSRGFEESLLLLRGEGLWLESHFFLCGLWLGVSPRDEKDAAGGQYDHNRQIRIQGRVGALLNEGSHQGRDHRGKTDCSREDTIDLVDDDGGTRLNALRVPHREGAQQA